MVCIAFSMSYTLIHSNRDWKALAGEDVGAGRAHEGQPRTVGAVADASLHRFETGAADRTYGVAWCPAQQNQPHIAFVAIEPPAEMKL
jgi:hypothetical protein